MPLLDSRMTHGNRLICVSQNVSPLVATVDVSTQAELSERV